MHMQRWATVNDVAISLSYMKFDGQEDLLVQAVEDGIWAALRACIRKEG